MGRPEPTAKKWRRRLFQAATVGVVAFWAVMMGLLVHRAFIRGMELPVLAEAAQAQLPTGEEWLGVYFRGQKIGHVHLSTSRVGEDYLLREESFLRLGMLGTRQEIRQRLRCTTGPDFRLKAFTFHMESPVASLRVRGEVRGQRLRLYIQTGGEKRVEEVRLARPIHLPLSLKARVASLGLKPGQVYRVPLFDPATLSPRDAVVVVEGMDTVKIGNRVISAYRIREEWEGITVRTWVAEDGTTLKEEHPSGWTLLKETRETALRMDTRGPLVDLVALTAVPVNREIPDPAKLRLLKLRIEGLNPKDLPELSGGRQRWEGGTLVIRREEVPESGPRLPLGGPGLDPYLAETPFVQAKDPKILRQARAVLSGETDAVRAARRLTRWVNAALRKEPVVSLPSALEVLSLRKGDCNEHTVLFTALARAVGLPTRMAAGVVYLRGRFYYHAWPEVYVGRWVAVDPTLDQFPADVTHLRLVEGGLEQQVPIAGLLGRLRIRVVAWE